MTTSTLGIKLIGGVNFGELQILAQPARVITNSSEPAVAGPAFDYADKTITVHLNYMNVGQPYAIVYRGAPAIAIKHADGKLGFYRVPKT